MLKKILIALVILIAIYLILCFAGPKTMEVDTTKTVSGTPAQVYAQIIDFRNWPNWSKWMKEDTQMNLTFGNPSYGVGGSYSWGSKKSGAGTMTITEASANQFMKADLKFSDMESVSKVVMELKPNGNHTDVNWKLKGEKEMPFFFRGIMLVTNMNARIRADFEEGLKNMDEYIKSGKAGTTIHGYTILESNFPESWYLGKRSTVSFKDIGQYFGTHFPEVGKLAGDKIVGPPSGLFWNWDEKAQKADMAAAFPVSIKEFLNDTYKIIPVPASKQFTIDYYGAYDKTQMAYAALDSLMKTKGIAHPEQVVEEYLTDPGTEKDTAKWLTRIHFLVK